MELAEGYKISCVEGVKITPDGKARPYIGNSERGSGRKVRIRYMEYPTDPDGSRDYFADLTRVFEVSAAAISVGFVGIDDVIDVVTG